MTSADLQPTSQPSDLDPGIRRDERRSREAPPHPLPINTHAPLASYHHHPGARLKLYCAACAWSRTYDPAKIAERLTALKRGGPMTPISAVAQSVQWPCPGCRRMRWVTVLVG